MFSFQDGFFALAKTRPAKLNLFYKGCDELIPPPTARRPVSVDEPPSPDFSRIRFSRCKGDVVGSAVVSRRSQARQCLCLSHRAFVSVCFCCFFLYCAGRLPSFHENHSHTRVKKCPAFFFSHVFILLCSCCQARIKSYFGDLIPRIVFYHSSPGLSAMERSSIGDGPEASPSTPGPALSALQLTPVGTPRLHNTVPVFPFVVSFLFYRAGFDGFDGSI